MTSVYSLTDPVFTPGIPCKRNWINDLKPCCVKNIIMLWWLLSKYLSYLHNFYQNMGIFIHVILILFFSRVFWEKNLLTPLVGSKKKNQHLDEKQAMNYCIWLTQVFVYAWMVIIFQAFWYVPCFPYFSNHYSDVY